MSLSHHEVPQAFDLTGQWQASAADTAETESRIAIKIWEEEGRWIGIFQNLGKTPERCRLRDLTLKGSLLRFFAGALSYAGEISADGNSIIGQRRVSHIRPLTLVRTTDETRWQLPVSSHASQFIQVEDDVHLEVFDWGGSGRPLVLLAGGGNSAHVFGAFAPKLTERYHVYGITRRGHGDSSAPAPNDENYSSDRLGDDVLAVIDALHLHRPVLVGHSIAGVELSSIGSRFPERVAGLIYLDCHSAYYDSSAGNYSVDINDLRRKLTRLLSHAEQREIIEPLVAELLQKDLPRMTEHMRLRQEHYRSTPNPKPTATVVTDAETSASKNSPVPPAFRAIFSSIEKYTRIDCPVLAIFNLPAISETAPQDNPRALQARKTRAYIDAFEAGIPQARVLRLPNATHYLFQSNEEEVLKELNAFMVKQA